MEGTSVVAVISVTASTVVALTGVVVPQVLGARKAASDRAIAHLSWWRDKRVELYSETLTFCARTLQSSNAAVDSEEVASLEGRIGTAGSELVMRLFSDFVEAARSADGERMGAAVGRLREHVLREVWELSKGSGNY
jgi:hypothetical protein